MTLAELAALAAKVDGFVRPIGEPCSACGGAGSYTDEPPLAAHPGDVLMRCGCGGEPAWDNSPAALLMAVVKCPNRFVKSCDEVDVQRPKDERGEWPWGACDLDNGTEESIARAALVALLRAHGVEVTDEP